MQEKEIEQKLVLMVHKAGGIAPKFVSPSFVGMPDRLVLLPDGKFGFVEVKQPGEVPRPIQEYRHKQLKDLGAKVYILDNPDEIGGIIDDIQSS